MNTTENLVNYSKQKAAKLTPPEKSATIVLPESKLQLIIKALTIAQIKTEILLQNEDRILGNEERMRLINQASAFQDLSQQLQNL